MEEPSSNSSDADSSFRSFLDRSLAAIEREVPAIHRELPRTLGRCLVRLCIDGERLVIASTGERLGLHGDVPGCQVEFTTQSATLLALTSGSTSFLDAAIDGHLSVKGDVDDVLRFYDGLILYLQGAARSPSLPWLLEEFERSRMPAC
jgi:hypothetical protein